MTYERYAQIRDSLGYKDAQVAAGTGIGKSTFSDWKSGRSVPKMPKLEKIASFFGVSVNDIYNEQEYAEEFIETNPNLKEAIEMAKRAKQVDVLVNLFENDLEFRTFLSNSRWANQLGLTE